MIYVFSKKGAYYERINIQGDFPNTKRGKGTKPTNVYNAMPTFYPTTSTTERCVKSVIKQEELKVHKRSDTSNVYPKLKDVAWEDNGERCVKSVIEVSNKKGRGQHPTQKPYELYEWLLKRYVPEKGTVLDPTAGSFTSCIVAKDLGYKAIGIEKDSKFFYKAIDSCI
jgi:DNA modification methylase